MEGDKRYTCIYAIDMVSGKDAVLAIDWCHALHSAMKGLMHYHAMKGLMHYHWLSRRSLSLHTVLYLFCHSNQDKQHNWHLDCLPKHFTNIDYLYYRMFF